MTKMPDKKLTDSEIIKALECCVGDKDGKNCFDCPLWEIDGCQEQLLLDALDIINRQKAENERLTTAHPKTIESIKKMRDKAKAEAYKEFAERLKEAPIKCALPLSGLSAKDEIEDYFNDIMLQVRDVIDNLLKELVGDNNETKTF